MSRYILVGANPRGILSHHGGVLTLSKGLMDHAAKRGHVVDVVNTMRLGFDQLSAWPRMKAGLGRLMDLAKGLRSGECQGVIIFSGAGLSFYERVLMAAICRLQGVRTLLVIVDGWFLELVKSSALKRWWIALLLGIPHKLAASGKRWVDFYGDFGVDPARIATIHYWLPAAFAIAEMPKAAAAEKGLRFIFVGWMIEEKGIHELLAAIEELRARHAFSFIFIGGGTLLEYVREKIRKSSWGESVSAPGWVSDDAFQEILSSCDVFVLPSYAEGFPMSLIEAFSRGLPAIATDVGGISDSLIDGVNGYLIPPRQVRPLAAAMERYLVDPAIVCRHSLAALQIVRTNHDAEANCALVLGALCRV